MHPDWARSQMVISKHNADIKFEIRFDFKYMRFHLQTASQDECITYAFLLCFGCLGADRCYSWRLDSLNWYLATISLPLCQPGNPGEDWWIYRADSIGSDNIITTTQNTTCAYFMGHSVFNELHWCFVSLSIVSVTVRQLWWTWINISN